MSNTKNEISVDVPTQIFNKFLEELKSTGVPTETIIRIEKVIFKKDTHSEVDIKSALFSDI